MCQTPSSAAQYACYSNAHCWAETWALTLQARIAAHSVQAEAEAAQVAADAADDELRLVQAASGALHAAAEQANRAAALQATAVEMQKAADEARMMAEIQVGGRHTRLDCKLKANEADCNKVLLGGGGGGGGGGGLL